MRKSRQNSFLKSIKNYAIFLLIGLICSTYSIPNNVSAASTGGCDNYTPTQGQTVTCTSTTSPAATTGVQSSTTTGNNNITVNILSGTILNFSGSSVGIGSGSTVNNDGTLNTNSFTNGYGISFGVNGRSNAGGNTVTNNGSIITGGTNGVGIIVSATLAGSVGNTVTNTGGITTTGPSSPGIYLKSGTTSASAINTIINSGTITTTGSNSAGIQVQGSANITNSGTINPTSGIAILFENGTSKNGLSNNVTLNSGSNITGSIAFNGSNTQETLNFSGLSNNNFNNSITGVNNINATSNAAVVMTNSNGYVISDSNPNLSVNVASGSTLSITSAISGTGNLIKGDTGTLTLGGVNSYSGMTNINAGTLSSGAADVIPNNSAVTVASGANWNLNNFNETVGSIAGEGNIALGSAALTAGGNNTSTTFSGVISGTGSLTKEGTGTLTLSGVNTYSGETNINAGTVILTGSITSNTNIANAATLQGGGTITGTLSNAGNITPSYTNIPTNLTVIGNYIGQGGTFNTNVYAPTSGTPTADQLIISGNGHTSSGTSSINVIDKGGLGSPTTGNGIQVITATNNATTASGTFSLGGRVASGAFEYRLFKGGQTANSTTDNNWYLRTDNPVPPTAVAITPDPRERIEVAVYPALPSLARLYAFSSIDTLEQRRSDLTTMGTDQKSTGQNGWVRITGRQGTNAPSNVNEGPKINFNSYSIQVGADLYQREDQTSRTYVGPFFTFGGSGGDTFNSANTQRTGKLSMLAYSMGMNAIYFNNNGLYVDAIGQITRFENMRAASTENADIFTKGWGFTASLESGFKLPLNQQWALTPQAQIVVDSINLDKTSDAYGEIEFNKDQVSRGRVGLMLSHQQKSGDENIKGWVRTSVWDVFKGGTNTGFSSLYGNNPIFFQSTTGSRWLALDAGLTAQLSKTSSAFVNLGWDTSFNSDYKAVYGKVGIQKRW